MPKVNAIINYVPHYLRKSLTIWRAQGVRGLFLGFERFFKRIIRKQAPDDYPRTQDYTPGLVSVAILTKNRLDLIQPCLESICKYPSSKYEIEILIGDTGTNETEVLQFYRNASDRYKNIKLILLGNYYFSKNYNQLIRDHAQGQYLILLNNDTLATENWLDNLVDPLADKNIGIVGAKLLYPDNTIQHAGLEFNEQRNAYHVYCKQPKNLPEANFPALVPGVTFACVALRHDVFDRFQLNEHFKHEAQDTDFCLRLAAAGFKVLYNPVVEVYHLECASRDWRQGILDRVRLQKMWSPTIKRLVA
ncbi:MAG: glycosyltransferase, partial [Desulfobaccales bacterium]